jgi:hypothetical protein
MPIKSLTNIATNTSTYTPLSATPLGEKVITLTIITDSIMTTSSNNTLSTNVPAGRYTMTDDPAHLFFKSLVTTGSVYAFYQS